MSQYKCDYCCDGLMFLTGSCPMCQIDTEYTYDTRSPEQKDPHDLCISLFRLDPIKLSVATRSMQGRPLNEYDKLQINSLAREVVNNLTQAIMQLGKVMPRP